MLFRSHSHLFGEALRASAIVAAGTALLQFGAAWQFFRLSQGRRAMPWFLLYLFVAWIVPLLLGAIAGLAHWQGGAEVLASVSPVTGLTISAAAGADEHVGFSVGLSLLLAALFHAGCWREMGRIEARVAREAAAPQGATSG